MNRKKETFIDSRFGIEREIKPMSITVESNENEVINVVNLNPRVAWTLIDILSENGMTVSVHPRNAEV